MSPGHEEPPLDRKQLLLTAWVDGALSVTERAEFEQLQAADPEFARQAAEHKALLDLARSSLLMEPSDLEVRRFWHRFYNRGEWRLGWCLLLGGLLVLAGFLLYELLVATTIPVIAKVAVCAVLLGAAILAWNSLRLKLRTSRFDRYRGVLY